MATQPFPPTERCSAATAGSSRPTRQSSVAPRVTKPDGTPNEAAFFDFFYDDMVSGVNKRLSVGTILSSPVVVDSVIYFGSADATSMP